MSSFQLHWKKFQGHFSFCFMSCHHCPFLFHFISEKKPETKRSEKEAMKIACMKWIAKLAVVFFTWRCVEWRCQDMMLKAERSMLCSLEWKACRSSGTILNTPMQTTVRLEWSTRCWPSLVTTSKEGMRPPITVLSISEGLVENILFLRTNHVNVGALERLTQRTPIWPSWHIVGVIFRWLKFLENHSRQTREQRGFVCGWKELDSHVMNISWLGMERAWACNKVWKGSIQRDSHFKLSECDCLTRIHDLEEVRPSHKNFRPLATHPET